VERRIVSAFEDVGASVSLHAVDLTTGDEVAVEENAPVILASVFKVLVALEFYAQVEEGRLDAATTVVIQPEQFTAGPTGVSAFDDAVRISLRDLCGLMLSVSDNTATDVLMAHVGLSDINARAQLCGCRSMVIESDLQTLFDGMAADVGFAGFSELAAAREGRLGKEARLRAAEVDHTRAFTATCTNRSTARDVTRLLTLIWRNEAASLLACSQVRRAMSRQVSTRIGRSLPDGAQFAGKTGSLTGRVRNEAGVITHADGREFVAAVFTRARQPFTHEREIEALMASCVSEAVAALKGASS
jgi:beta-lactamase class A